MGFGGYSGMERKTGHRTQAVHALMVGLKQTKALDMPGVRTALATALFKDGELSLVRSAHLADMPLTDFISHISRLRIPVIE